jgi:hypothetical protein
VELTNIVDDANSGASASATSCTCASVGRKALASPAAAVSAPIVIPLAVLAVAGDEKFTSENISPEQPAATAKIKNPVISFLTSIINIDYSPKRKRLPQELSP